MDRQEQQALAARPPGRMSVMMREAAGPGPKVLRVGMVRGGRVLEERVVRGHASVTVGPSERCTFVIRAADVAKPFRLFDWAHGKYWLNVLPSMGGRVEIDEEVIDLESLRAKLPKGPQGSGRVGLNERARGKVVLGEVTFLFQFINLPSLRTRHQLPASVLEGTAPVDWPTTVIAAFSFLAHFLAIAALYSDWMDPVVDYDISVKNLVESVRSLPPPPPVEEQKADDAQQKDPLKEVAPKPKPAAKAVASEKAKLSATQIAAISSEFDRIEMSIIPALQGAGPAAADVLQGGEISMQALDDAAASSAGVSSAGPGGLRLGNAGGALRPGEAGGGLAAIGSTGKTGGEGSGKGVAVKGPTGSATIEQQQVTGGAISDARAVIASMRTGFRACYQRGLANNPDAQGKITLNIKVGPGGEVQSVSGASSGNIAPEVLDCVKQRAMAARFSPPEGGTAVVQVPVSFVRQ